MSQDQKPRLRHEHTLLAYPNAAPYATAESGGARARGIPSKEIAHGDP